MRKARESEQKGRDDLVTTKQEVKGKGQQGQQGSHVLKKDQDLFMPILYQPPAKIIRNNPEHL